MFGNKVNFLLVKLSLILSETFPDFLNYCEKNFLHNQTINTSNNPFVFFYQMDFIEVNQLSFIHDLGPKGL